MRVFTKYGEERGIGAAGPTGPSSELPRVFTLELPVNGEKFIICSFKTGVTIGKLQAILKGSSSPSVSWKVRYGPDPTAAGTSVVNAGTTTTATTAVQNITSLDNVSPNAGDVLWIEITAVSGVVEQLSVSICP